jgi:LacI family transcriptional regulator
MRPQDLAGLLAADLPVVLINSVHSERAGSVVLDDARGAELGTDHLIELGHTRIALVNGLPPSDTARRRELGFRTAMERAGLDVAEEHVTRLGYEPRTGADAMAQLAELDDLPTAIFVANVNAAHGVLRQAHLLGLRVPEDISVIAMHDTWTAEMTWPPLTTVRMPLYELGRTAMRALRERMDAGKAVDLVVDEPEPVLVMRESTAAVPVRSSDE